MDLQEKVAELEEVKSHLKCWITETPRFRSLLKKSDF